MDAPSFLGASILAGDVLFVANRCWRRYPLSCVCPGVLLSEDKLFEAELLAQKLQAF